VPRRGAAVLRPHLENDDYWQFSSREIKKPPEREALDAIFYGDEYTSSYRFVNEFILAVESVGYGY
jgi:hypothetical protein